MTGPEGASLCPVSPFFRLPEYLRKVPTDERFTLIRRTNLVLGLATCSCLGRPIRSHTHQAGHSLSAEAGSLIASDCVCCAEAIALRSRIHHRIRRTWFVRCG